MKYKDYYAALGVPRTATEAEIKRAYRRLAQKYHPDVSKEAGAEEKFKEVAEAYQTLKDKDKRAAYDQLGSRPEGQEFRPPPDWQQQFGDKGAEFSFEDIDLGDLFAHLRGAQAQRSAAGEDFEIAVPITLEQAYGGTEIDLDLSMPERDAEGRLRRVPRSFKARIPKGATYGQRLRIPGKGGKGRNGGRDGDLYLNITLKPHPLYRVDGHDLYLDLPLAPWEAVLGAAVEVPTLAGTVRLKVPAGTYAGQRFRLPHRGLPKPHAGQGDLYALAQIAVPRTPTATEKSAYEALAQASTFDPRTQFSETLAQESAHAR
jgi:curved DNA-binding protein